MLTTLSNDKVKQTSEKQNRQKNSNILSLISFPLPFFDYLTYMYYIYIY